ncbi:MAG: cyclodeaminase/cyclohydrolase family protein [Oscillospiraceae bacterium]|nr:cyclodeaminase/cyclohydrolase family protein [Oscillospiraceae bacterium]
MSEKWMLHSCAAFTEKLASRDPVPGGGGAAALMGALGAALCEMAGNLTVGKKKYAVYEDDLRRMITEADALRQRLLELIDEDARAFVPLSKAYSLPKDSPDYEDTLRFVTINACKAPYEMMESCAKAVTLLEEMQEKCSVLMISDVGCGAIAAKAALEAAAMNVFINTRSLPGDGEALLMELKAEALLSEYVPRAQKIADSVMESLRRRNNG